MKYAALGTYRRFHVTSFFPTTDRGSPAFVSRSTKLTARVVRTGPGVVTMGPMVRVELQRIEALELLAMTLAHLNDAEARVEVSPRVPPLMAIRDKLAQGLREE
jgi:hypothetical protein